MKERPILMSAPMVVASLDESKTQTRRVMKPQPPQHTVAVGRWQDPPGYDSAWWAYVREGAIEQDHPFGGAEIHGEPWRCPYGQPGDRLWVRETFFAWGRWETRFNAKKGRDEWHFVDMTLECGQSYLYAADRVRDTMAFIKRRGGVEPMYWKRPAIFMPRAASRITLEVASVRVERLQDISEADAMAEGTPCYVCGGPMNGLSEDDCHCFHNKAKPSDYRALWESINGEGSWSLNPWVWVVEFKRVAA